MILDCELVEQVVEQDALVKPWECSPFSLISWWDVEKFSAKTFYLISELMERIRKSAEQEQPNGQHNTVAEFLTQVVFYCEQIGLRFSVRYIQEMLGELPEQKPQ